LIITHATNVRMGHILFGLEESYPRILYRYWVLSPVVGLSRQFALLLVLWIHGCIGLYSWIHFKPWYAKWAPTLAVLVVLIPVLAVIGIADAGRDLDSHIARDIAFTPRVNVQTAQQSAALTALGERLVKIYLCLVGGVLLARGLRKWRAQRFAGVTIRYPQGQEVVVPRGFSILEASRWAGVAHTSICGGRGRCSTCRVLVTAGLDQLHPPNAAELATLAWIGAYRGVRLACQVRPRADLDIVPLLDPGDADVARLATPFPVSEEHDIAAFFVDLRNSTQLADGRLPYDALYVIDRYVAAVARTAQANGGQVTSVAGDGVMCFFGGDCDTETACRRAVFTLRDLWRSLEALNAEFEIAFNFPLRFGAGCHLGLAIVGELASRPGTHFLGEVGNIAARLETLTKQLECTIIVSRAVVEQGGFAFDPEASRLVRIENVTAPVEIVSFKEAEELDALVTTLEPTPGERRRPRRRFKPPPSDQN
jgi:adenylate cyclase